MDRYSSAGADMLVARIKPNGRGLDPGFVAFSLPREQRVCAAARVLGVT